MAGSNYNKQWIAARQNSQTLQGSVLCTWANIFLPTADGKIKSVFSFQRHRGQYQQDLYTIIQDDFVAELSWINSVAGQTSPWGNLSIGKKNGETLYSYADILGKHNFFNPDTLHLGRLTEAGIAEIEYCTDRSLTGYLQASPYILYRPKQWRWETKVPTNVEDYLPEYGKAQKKSRAIELGTATSLAMLLL